MILWVWDGVPPIVRDTTGDEDGWVDITDCYVTHDEGPFSLYFRMDLVDGPTEAGYYVFMDTDRNLETGGAVGEDTIANIGADYMICNDALYRWEEAGSWGWVKAIDWVQHFDLHLMEWGLAFEDIGISAGQPIDIVFATNLPDTDYAPDTGYVTYPGVPSVTGRGIVTFTSDKGTLQDLTVVDEADLPSEGKPNLNFPYGFFSFLVTGLTPGDTVTVTITFPAPMPTTTQYWKYHVPEGWIQITTLGDNDGDDTLTIQLTDGGLGDDDGVADGTIVDQAAPGNPPAPSVGGEAYPVDKLALLAPYFAAMLVITTGALVIKRRRT